MIAVGNTIIIKLVKEKVKGGEKVLDNGLIAVGNTDKDNNDILNKWKGEVVSIGEEVSINSPVNLGSVVRIFENAGVPIIEEESEDTIIRYVSVKYGDILAVIEDED